MCLWTKEKFYRSMKSMNQAHATRKFYLLILLYSEIIPVKRSRKVAKHSVLSVSITLGH